MEVVCISGETVKCFMHLLIGYGESFMGFIFFKCLIVKGSKPSLNLTNFILFISIET